jgi:hypothetical protein
MRVLLGSVAGVLAAGFLVLLLWGGFGGGADPQEIVRPEPAPPGASQPSPASSLAVEGEIDELRQLLAAKDAELDTIRGLLEESTTLLANLEEEVDWVRGELAWLQDQPGSGEVAEEESPDEGLPAETRPLFDAQALVQAGLDPSRAEWLRERFEESELDRLYLRDQATREGWLRTPRFAMANLARNEKLKQELGLESYDLMLYAARRKNRVGVEHVLSDSEAQAAGFEPGDVIVSYAGRRVFNLFDLHALTASGVLGEPVHVEILRSGDRLRLRIPRGPVGVTVEAKRILPELHH